MRLLILRKAGWKSCSTVGDITKMPMQQNVRQKGSGSVLVLGGCGGNHPQVAREHRHADCRLHTK